MAIGLPTTAGADPGTSLEAARSLLPPDRRTVWNPGRMSIGGIPVRSTVCARVDAGAFGNGATDSTAAIQAAINSCPSGQVVLLSAGTFLANDLVLINKAITLRGAGAGKTVIRKANGAAMNLETTPNAQPNIIIGPNRWPQADNAGSKNLTADAAQGSLTVTVADARAMHAGEFVLVDQLSGASWQPDRLGRGQIWASPDYRVVWQLHNPRQSWDDPLEASTPTGGAAAGWFSRPDRVIAEIKEIASIDGNTITFTSPLHADFRVAGVAQVTRYTGGNVHVRDAGVEDLTVTGGSDGGIRFEAAAYSWLKGVEVTVWHGEGIALDDSFRIKVRDSYVHDAAWAQPGGAGYAISVAGGSAEALFENNIILKANKVMVGRSAGAGSVFGYNYVDNGYINTIEGWIEVGLNASHMVGSHHVLFEGNYGFNWDSDHTHGNATYHTAFRNYIRCLRSPFVNPLSGRLVNDAKQPGNGPKRCIGATGYSSWMSFIGNVLGAPGQMGGWVYESTGPMAMSRAAIWLLGWDDISPQPYDPQTAKTTLRYANFDYLTNSVRSDPGVGERPLPPSLYLPAKPDFFKAGSGYRWPWVDPEDATKSYTLPAKARFDAGTPFVQP
jgi:pectate lyase-like protein